MGEVGHRLGTDVKCYLDELQIYHSVGPPPRILPAALSPQCQGAERSDRTRFVPFMYN